MIDLAELKSVIEPLFEGREDAASIIESIQGLDREVTPDQGAIDSAVAKANAEWNQRYKEAFFGPKAGNMTGQPQDTDGDNTVINSSGDESASGVFDSQGGEEVSGANITIDDLFDEKILD